MLIIRRSNCIVTASGIVILRKQLFSASVESGHLEDYNVIYTGYTQKKGAVSKVNKKFISHLTRAQPTPSAAATVQVSHALPAVRFSCLLRGRGAAGPRGQFPRWRRSRRRLSVC